MVATLALAGAVAADPDTIDAKRAQAEDVLAQIRELDLELELAVDDWNGANVRLRELQGELTVNERRLEIARAGLRSAQTTVEERLISLYQGGEVDVVEVVLGATSFDDLLDGLDTAHRVAEGDARILEDVRRSKAEVEQRRTALESLRAAEDDRRAAGRAPCRDRGWAHRAPGALRLGPRGDRRARSRGAAAPGPPCRPRPAARPPRSSAGKPHVAPPRTPSPTRRHTGARPRSHPGADSGSGSAARGPRASRGRTDRAPLPRGSVLLGRRLAVRLRLLGVHDVRLCADRDLAAALRLVAVPLREPGLTRAARAGDLVFFNDLGHVGIAIGGGRFVHAAHTGDVVKISSIWDSWYASSWVGARRL